MNMSCLTGKQLIAEQVTACWKAKVRLNCLQTLKFQCNIRYNPDIPNPEELIKCKKL